MNASAADRLSRRYQQLPAQELSAYAYCHNRGTSCFAARQAPQAELEAAAREHRSATGHETRCVLATAQVIFAGVRAEGL